MQALKLVAKGLLFLPVLAFMVYTSYTVDPSGSFHGQQFDRYAVELLSSGKAVGKYDNLLTHTRSINEAMVMNHPAFDTIVIGSSRSLLIDAQIARAKGSFYNMSAVGADYMDLIGTFYITLRENKLPKRVILGIDPWMLNIDSIDNKQRSNQDLYLAFLKASLGFPDVHYDMPDPAAKWKQLLEPAYFQGAVTYSKRDKTQDLRPEEVPLEELEEYGYVVKLPDGTIQYDRFFRNRTEAQINDDIDGVIAASLHGVRIEDFPTPSAALQKQLTAYVDFLQQKGIEVILYLPGYPPTVYDALEKQRQKYSGFFAVEPWVRELAVQKGITVVGSYDPKIYNLTTADFYDQLHLRKTATARIFDKAYFKTST